jgi:hypothetical protein
LSFLSPSWSFRPSLTPPLSGNTAREQDDKSHNGSGGRVPVPVPSSHFGGNGDGSASRKLAMVMAMMAVTPPKDMGMKMPKDAPAPVPTRKPRTAKPTPDPSCTYAFSAEGARILKCMEWLVKGCYLDSKCHWTLFIGHLAQKAPGVKSYEKCCDLLKSGKTAEAFFEQDTTEKTQAVIRNLNLNPTYCKGGSEALTQGEFDALVTATFHGAVDYTWYRLGKAELLTKVRERTLRDGKDKRLKPFDALWNGVPYSCQVETLEPGNAYLQSTCRRCTAATADPDDDQLCDAAADKQCCLPGDDPASPPKACCVDEFQCAGTEPFCHRDESLLCRCSNTVEGSKFCWLGSEFCRDAVRCASSANCVGGRKCVPITCCLGAGGVCVQACPKAAPSQPPPTWEAVIAGECAGTLGGCPAGEK